MKKDNEKKLVYNFNEHGLYYKGCDVCEYDSLVLTMGTVQLEFGFGTGKFLGITGYIPLTKAEKGILDIPNCLLCDFSVSIDEAYYQCGMAYDYFDFFPENEDHFMVDEYNPRLTYDDANRRLLFGPSGSDKYIRVSKNIICGLDSNDCLRNVLVTIDEVIM